MPSELHTMYSYYIPVGKRPKLGFELSIDQSRITQPVVEVILNFGCSLESLEKGREGF